MSYINQLKLSVIDKQTQVLRTALLAEVTGPDSFGVHWEITDDISAFESTRSILHTGHWKALRVQVREDNGICRTEYFTNKSDSVGWAHVRRLLFQKNARQRACSQVLFPEQGERYSRYANGREYAQVPSQAYGREFTWLRSGRIFHQSIRDIVDKHYHACNAVVILPDSWLDNKLKEAYVSRRTPVEETDLK